MHVKSQFDIIVNILDLADDADDETLKGLLIDTAMDVAGIPVDNTDATHATDVANTTGEWPEHAFCRDKITALTEQYLLNNDSRSVADWLLHEARKLRL